MSEIGEHKFSFYRREIYNRVIGYISSIIMKIAKYYEIIIYSDLAKIIYENSEKSFKVFEHETRDYVGKKLDTKDIIAKEGLDILVDESNIEKENIDKLLVRDDVL